MRSGFYAAAATDESLKPRLWVVWMMLFYSSSSRNGTASAVRSPAMSALGQKRTLKRLGPMSALPPKADIAEHDWHVRFVSRHWHAYKITSSAGASSVSGI